MNDGTMQPAVDLTVTPAEDRAIVELLRWGRESTVGVGQVARWRLADRVAQATDDALYFADVPGDGEWRVPTVESGATLEDWLAYAWSRDRADGHVQADGTDWGTILEWAGYGAEDYREGRDGDPACWIHDDSSDVTDWAYWAGYNYTQAAVTS